MYDAAYECFAQDGAARSIYEAEGAEKCAVEFCSFSKTAGFTGTRCGYTVVPSTLVVGGVSLKDMWYRRQSTKTNGVSYVVQRGAAAVFTEEGERQIGKNLAFYRENARIIAACMENCGISYTGGKNSPLYLAEMSRRNEKLGIFRLFIKRSAGSGHAGERVRPQRRGLFPPHGIRKQRDDEGSVRKD